MIRRRGIEPRNAAFPPHGARLFAVVAKAALTAWPIALCLALPACGSGATGSGSGGVAASDAQRLNDAAAMLDRNSVSTDALPNTMTEPDP